MFLDHYHEKLQDKERRKTANLKGQLTYPYQPTWTENIAQVH